MATYLSSFTLLLVIFNIVFTSKLSAGTRNHAYFSTNDDTQFISDNLPVSFHKDFTGTTGKISIDESLFNSRIHLKFLPPILDFKERHLGIPHHERVTIINLSCNRTIFMSSISGSTVHFHSSFFQDKIIPPLGNTSFSIVFLGRGEGEINSYLYIHTSEGSFKYQVRGDSIRSPYRLRSLSGVKLPLNSTYTPEIFMHNPHPTTLQILEVYSSGNEFHLELPSGELGGPKHIWQIPAFSTKPIIRLRFYASSQKNHSAYVRLKLDKDNQILMIPVDVEVGSECGLYSPDDFIDFGIGGSQDPPKQIKIYLKNSSKKPVRVLSITTTPLSKALKIDFKPIVVPPKSKNSTEVALLTFDWNSAYKFGFRSGKITIKSNQLNEKLVLKYRASVLLGGLEYNGSQLRFKSDERDILPRVISVKNNFNIPIVLTNVSLCQLANKFFEVKNFSPMIILPEESKSIFSLDTKNIFERDLKMEFQIHISSNASSLIVPLVSYNGKLKKVVLMDMDGSYFSLGSSGFGNTKTFYFGLINENPIDVYIKNIGVNISEAIAGIVAAESGNITKVLHALRSEYDLNIIEELILAPRSYCIVQVSIPAYEIGYIYGQVSILTDFEDLYVDIKLKVDEVKDVEVIANPAKHGTCFLKDVCTSEFLVESHFTVSLIGSDITNILHQATLGFLSPHIFPFADSFLHYFSFNTSETRSCLSLITNSSDSQKWINSLYLPFYSKKWDTNLLIMHYENYLRLSAELMKLTIWLNASENQNLSSKGVINAEWPSETTHGHSTVEFSATEIGNTTYTNVISNTVPLQPPVAQLILEPTYPSNDVQNELISSSNVSALEVFKLMGMGSGAYGQFKFGNRKPGSSSPLLFELSDKHLRGCERKCDGKISRPILTVRRSFIAKNTGIVPLSIVGFMINGNPCEGFGFRIINCQPFLLPANSSRKIDIGFTPDFTLSKVNRALTVLTLGSSVNYTLAATLPPYLLSVCSNAIKRPAWEPLVYYSAVSSMLFLLICILGAAFFEANRILRNAIITLKRDNIVKPILDLRMIGSEAVSVAEQNSVINDNKLIWSQKPNSDEQVNKDIQKPATDNIFTNSYNNKCQILNSGISCKKKSERAICKRFSDGSENYVNKTCWETSYARTNNAQLVKPLKTSICITTEPYIPLTNIKSRDSSLQKSDYATSKFDQTRFIEFQRRKTKKKGHGLNNNDITKKKPVDLVPMRNIFEESESSAMSESSCSDGEKDVESMFFQSVRHHLQSKVSRGRHVKLTSSSPLTKRKKSIEKSPVNIVDNDWGDVDDDESSEKATIVRNNRRSSAVKQLKKQNVNYGKMKFEPSQVRVKQNVSEKNVKCCTKKEKILATKKRNERLEKRVASIKAFSSLASQDGIIPAASSPPVWTASFSDVVARNDSSYSSVAAAKNNTTSQNQKQQLNISSIDSGSSCSGSSVTNFPAGWKTEYQDALEQQDSSNEQVSGDMKHPVNNVWGNWSSLAETLQTQPNVLQTSANSLFTDGSTQGSSYDPVWNDQNLLKVMQEQQEIENMASFHGTRNEVNWPVITSLWDPLYTPSSSAVESPPPVWGSDVWGPPVSPPPNPPVTEDVQSNLEYDPFRSLSNIWAQHSPNIWKPPSSE